jgi:aquaporin Z
MKRFLAEALGTFALVFCGTGAIIINQQSGGVIGHAGIAATFGLIVTAMIYTFGNLSGAHFNPAVTIAFAAAGLFKWREVPPYTVAQLTGAFLASLLLKALFASNPTLGATLPAGSDMQSFILETVLTFFLMLVILFTSQGSKEAGVMAGIAIGATVLLEAMFAGPICGASMNPARSIAPAVVSAHIQSLWIYIAAPILGALIATVAWHGLKEQKST